MPHGKHLMNIWHGDKFPVENSADDGYEKTCPVISSPLYSRCFDNIGWRV